MKPPGARERRIIKVMVLLGLFSILNFLLFFFHPDNRGNLFLYILLSITLLYGTAKKLYMWYNYTNISVPEQPSKMPDLKVDILTTYFPGEPYQMIVTTLEAISKITYPHTTFLCDEADDPFLKKFCEENGVVHVTRENRKDAKAGNINNALRQQAKGDICVILDPDHIPEPDFLDPILPHFSDPDIGFVQIVQSYYNIKDSLVARGAAEQTFQFYGPMMMTLNAYGSVNAIGANCVFRRAALDSIGGHAPGLCEDMHTAMLLYSKGWKAVYVPEVLAKGLAPSSLTTYFKQQLKWTRGTFDLLLKVYPKVFSKLNIRQKIHFGILPLHYLCGVIYLINFLIPILALFLSTTPWHGNIINFILVALPVGISALMIRTFVQKWVIEKEERGFHIVGGLLQINTWWIYLLGFIYTLINKNVPYLPTPKQSEFDTNLKIVIPNAIVASISIFAIFYGLQQDLTPFSIIMAGFAFFNSLIMLFGIYLSVRVTNQNRILTTNLRKNTVRQLWKFRVFLREMFHSAFTVTRKLALPMLVFALIISLGYKERNSKDRWEHVAPLYYPKVSENYLGIFYPSQNDGMVDLEEVNAIEARKNINFDIISFYLAWTEESVTDFPEGIMNFIAAKNAIPMITWEPWISELDKNEDSRRTFQRIAAGEFDSYIKAFASELASYERPIFLRFAHEFDNPQYPWHISKDNSAEDFKAAWKHVHRLIKEQGANEVVFVWNPWKARSMQKFYPGDDYVDWIGVTLLNYGPLAKDGEEYSFSRLYQPFHNRIQAFTRKPVMLAEFNSVDLGGQQQKWLNNAMTSITSDYSEIHAVVLFNSAFDENIPKNSWYKNKYIDWSIDSIQAVADVFDHSPEIRTTVTPNLKNDILPRKLGEQDLKGVHYKKGIDWKDNYYVLTKERVTEDFELIKSRGFNSIQYAGGNIYDYNVLKYAEEFNLQVLYKFDLKPSTGFNDKKKLKDLERDILEKAQDLQDKPHVVALVFDLDLSPYFEKPLLFYQKNALLEWLQPLMIKIKKSAPEKSIIIELPLDQGTSQYITELKKKLPVDSYGLNLNSSKTFPNVTNLSKQLSVPLFISSIKPGQFLKNHNSISNMGFLLENWQDERLSYRLSFDGLLDHEGRPKKVLSQIEKLLENKKPEAASDSEVIRILKPAVPLLAGETATYHAMLYKNGGWVSAANDPAGLSFEWSLVKNDKYGNHLALKDLDEGPTTEVNIPQDYRQYELLLTVENSQTGLVHQTKSQLHTPLEN